VQNIFSEPGVFADTIQKITGQSKTPDAITKGRRIKMHADTSG